MNLKISSQTVKTLRSMYTADPAAAAILDALATYSRARRETTVENMSRWAEVPYREAVRVARELDAAGCGRFTTGRKGHPSRMVWEHPPGAIGKAAKGEAEDVPGLDAEWDDTDEAQGDPRKVLQQAKQDVATAFGVDLDKVEITVRA